MQKTDLLLPNGEYIEIQDINIELEEQVKRLLIYSRLECNLTQKQLSEKSGIRQSNISRIENGSCIPTIETIKQLAHAMGKKVKIEFI
ncbi:MAG: helix-turn-helix transcriptional regulator [Lachnospiraceae bacterium]|nr:helix-turn-helix transcriptional regulator [Lachnospiraceae bacterium]